ncbi:MAG TPA: uridine kinase [Nannocystis sp.]
MSREQPVLIGIAGGSGSGKTYLARRIQREVGPQHVSVLSMDQYFRSLGPEERRLDRRDINFDHPSHIDCELLQRHIEQLRAGQPVLAPSYDFRNQIQTPEAIRVEPARVIVVEGLFVLRPPLVELFDLTVFLDVDADQRLIGRLLRDLEERDSDVRWNIDRYQRFVRPGFEMFVQPTMLNADVVVDFTYRRIFFQELMVDLVRDYVSHGYDIRGLIRSVRNDRYQLGVQPRRGPVEPPTSEPSPAAAPTLFVGDNPQGKAGVDPTCGES